MFIFLFFVNFTFIGFVISHLCYFFQLFHFFNMACFSYYSSCLSIILSLIALSIVITVSKSLIFIKAHILAASSEIWPCFVIVRKSSLKLMIFCIVLSSDNWL